MNSVDVWLPVRLISEGILLLRCILITIYRVVIREDLLIVCFVSFSYDSLKTCWKLFFYYRNIVLLALGKFVIYGFKEILKMGSHFCHDV